MIMKNMIEICLFCDTLSVSQFFYVNFFKEVKKPRSFSTMRFIKILFAEDCQEFRGSKKI